MANLLVLGTQWGDEGKGKIVDLLTPAFDIVARYQGGHNAGHTVYVNGRKIVLHLIPSGNSSSRESRASSGTGSSSLPRPSSGRSRTSLSGGAAADAGRIVVSDKAHLIMPYHPVVERISEEARGAKKIGTTCRGIGPAYEDKAARWGIRAGDLLNLGRAPGQDRRERRGQEQAASRRTAPPPSTPARSSKNMPATPPRMRPFIRDVSLFLHEEMKKGKRILFEGAQGVLLDLDHGTYPFVTSSSSTAGGAATGLGVGPKSIHGILGITKAYTTRVGSGPFPTELARRARAGSWRPGATNSGRRPGGRAAAAGSTPWPSATPAASTGSTGSP